MFTIEYGSSELPNRLLSRLTPFATPRIIPCSRVKKTTIRSASARLYDLMTRLSDSKSDIYLQRNKVKDPGQNKTYDNELSKCLSTVDDPLARSSACECPECNR